MTLGEYIKQLRKEEEERYKQAIAPITKMLDTAVKLKKQEKADLGILKTTYETYGTPVGVDLNNEDTLKQKL